MHDDAENQRYKRQSDNTRRSSPPWLHWDLFRRLIRR